MNTSSTSTPPRRQFGPDTRPIRLHRSDTKTSQNLRFKKISERQLARKKRTRISQDRVVKELARLSFSDVRKLFRKDGTLKAPHEMTAGEAACLSSIESFEKFEGVGDAREHVGTVRKIRMWDKLAALEKLGKHLGMWSDRMPLEAFLALFPGPIAERLCQHLGDEAAKRGIDRGDPEHPESTGV